MFSGRTQSKMIKDFGIKYVEGTFLKAKFIQLSVETVLILSQKQEKDFFAYAFTIGRKIELLIINELITITEDLRTYS